MSDSMTPGPARGWFNLNQDITQALDGLGKVDLLAVLRAHFPARHLTPREYLRVHPVARRVRCVYAGAQGELPASCPLGWDLVVVTGVGFNRRETEEVFERLQAARGGPKVLFGLPSEPLPGSAQLKELAALDRLALRGPYDEPGPPREALETRRASLRASVRERLRRALAPGRFRWLIEGRVLEDAPAGGRKAFLTGALESIYTDTPRVHLAGSARARREAQDVLLDLAHPLYDAPVIRSGAWRVLRRALVETGILQAEEASGSLERFQVRWRVPGDSPLAPAWGWLWRRALQDQGPGGLGLETLVEEMARPPLGLRGPLPGLLLGALLRGLYPDVVLCHEGEEVPLSGVALRQALQRPKGWTLRAWIATPHEDRFLAELRTAFGGLEEGGLFDPWERTLAALLAWMDSLPPLALAEAAGAGEAAACLMAALRRDPGELNPREWLGLTLPQAFGVPGLPLEGAELSALLQQVEQGRLQVEQIMPARQRALIREIGRLLGLGEVPSGAWEGWLDEGARRWLATLHPATPRRAFSDQAEGLRSVIADQGAPEGRWFSRLPAALDLPPVAEWTRDLAPLLLARLARARMELELWSLRELFPLSPEPSERALRLSEWMGASMEGAGLSLEERESLLLDLLEEQVWNPPARGGPEASTPRPGRP